MRGKHAAPSKFDIEIEELRTRRVKTNGGRGDREFNDREGAGNDRRGSGRKGRDGKGGRRKLVLLVLLAAACFAIWAYWFKPIDVSKFVYPDWISQQFITQDGHSRTGLKTDRINAIVIHYTANPGATAQNNRDYFNSPQSNVSSHFVVGLEG